MDYMDMEKILTDRLPIFKQCKNKKINEQTELTGSENKY